MNTSRQIFVPLFIIVLVVALGGWFWSNPLTGDEPIHIASADGVVTLQIPDGALPPGLTLADISVREVEAQTFWGSVVEVPGGAYELLPDGAVFAKPIILHIETTATSSGTIPQLLHVASGTVEMLNPSVVRIDAGTKRIEAEFAISHFSKVGVDARYGTFKYELTSGGTAPVGGSLPYAFTISVEEHSHWYQNGVGYEPAQHERARALRSPRDRDRVSEELPGGYMYRVAPGTMYSVAGSEVRTLFLSQNVLSPERMATPPREQKTYEPYRFTTQFICQNPGKAFVNFDTSISYRMYRGGQNILDSYGHEKPNNLGTYTTEETHVYLGGEQYECTGAPVVKKQEEPPRVAPPTTAPTTPVVAKPPAQKPSGSVMTVCGLPGGPACPKR